MAENLVHSFLDLFSGMIGMPFGKEIIIFIISMMPILELRGGLIAASLLNMNPIVSFIVCFTPLFDRLKRTKHLSKWVTKIENKAISKKEQIEKREFWGLLLFVGIPLPGTGAWTGSLIASIIGMNKKKSLFASFLGVTMAGIIMLVLSFGLLKGIIG